MTRILLTLSLICLIMTGCSNSNEPIEFEDETQTIDLAEYEEVVYKNRELLSDWAYAMQDAQEEGTRAASMEEAECFEALKQKSTSICHHEIASGVCGNMSFVSENVFDIYSSTFYQCVVVIGLIVANINLIWLVQIARMLNGYW